MLKTSLDFRSLNCLQIKKLLTCIRAFLRLQITGILALPLLLVKRTKERLGMEDTRDWDKIQKGIVQNECEFILDILKTDGDNSLLEVREEVLALMDFIFPTGFSYTSNKGPDVGLRDIK